MNPFFNTGYYLIAPNITVDCVVQQHFSRCNNNNNNNNLDACVYMQKRNAYTNNITLLRQSAAVLNYGIFNLWSTEMASLLDTTVLCTVIGNNYMKNEISEV